jgi:HNH endonuclease
VSVPTQVELFWHLVQRLGENECWPWLGFRKPSGHGLTGYMGTSIHASRKAWILTNGQIAKDLCVNHKCDNAWCCNPAHMYLGTRADNMVDLWAKTPPDERKPGRKYALDANELARMWEMRREGATLKACAAEFHVHIATVCRYITAVRQQKLAKNRADRLTRAQQPLV